MTNTRGGEEAAPPRASGWAWPVAAFFVTVAVAVALLRLYFCFNMPANTGDLWRHLNYGRAINDPNLSGLTMATLPLTEFMAGAKDISWSTIPYNYPILTLLYFVAVTSPPGMFVAGKLELILGAGATPGAGLAVLAKLLFTLMEAGGAVLLAKFTRDKWLGLIYWASPLSIWWVSQEGQFEPLANIFSFAALAVLRSSPPLAFAALAGAIQVKVLPGALLFYLLWQVRGQGLPMLLRCMVMFAVAMVPSVQAEFAYPHASQVLRNSSPMQYNPYYWNPLNAQMFSMPPFYEAPFNQLAIKGYLLAALWCAWRSRRWMEYVPALLFLYFCSMHHNVIYWYFIMLAPLFAPVSSPVQRRWFIGMTFLFSIWGLLQIFTGAHVPR